MMLPDAVLIKMWIESVCTLSERTLVQYEREAERFSSWLRQHSGELLSCKEENLLAYFDALCTPPVSEGYVFEVRRRKALTDSSLAQTRRILGLFLSWLVREGYAATNPLDKLCFSLRKTKTIGASSHRQLTVSRDILETVLSKIELDSSEELLRSRVISHLAFWSGASSTELSRLKLNEIQDIGGEKFLQLPSSGINQKQLVGLPDATAKIIDAYILARVRRGLRIDGEMPLIISLRGGKGVSSWTIWHTVRSSDKDRECATGSPQQLRRAFQETAVRGGIQERIVAKHLRRQSLARKVINSSGILVNTRQLHDAVRHSIKGLLYP